MKKRRNERGRCLCVGLTGGFATGKSTVAGMFARRGAKVLDADRVAHALLAPSGACVGPVTRRFGQAVLTKGRIDRKKLAAVVFRSPAALKRLNAIIHPRVREVFEDGIARVRKSGRSEVVVLDVPLLFESGMDALADFTVTVTAPRELQVRRAMAKMGLSRTEVLARIRRQMPLREKVSRSDIVINNKGSLQQTQSQVDRIWDNWVKRFINRTP